LTVTNDERDERIAKLENRLASLEAAIVALATGRPIGITSDGRVVVADLHR
jgi:hypothetical protein